MVSLPYTEFSKEQLRYLDSLRKPKDKNMGLIEASSKSAVVFAEHMLGMKLYYWEIAFLVKLQCTLLGTPLPKILRAVDYIDVKKTMVLALTSRQIGKTTIVSVLSIWVSFFNKRPDKRFNSTRVSLVSRGFEQAKSVLREIRRTFLDGDRFMSETYRDEEGNSIFDTKGSDGRVVGYFSSKLSKEDGNNATMINWRKYDKAKDGLALLNSRASSGIICLPPTDSVLGFTFTVGIVDESGHPKIEDGWWFDSFKKTGDANQALWVFTSTPWQPSGFFYEYCDVENKNSTNYIEKVVATIDTLKQDMDAGNEAAKLQYEGVMADIKKDESLGKIDSVRRGYYCEFVRGETSYFDPDNTQRSFKEDLQMYDNYQGQCDLGVDFGAQKVSKTTLTITALIDDKITRLWAKSYDRGTDLNLVEDIALLKQRFNIQRIIPDECAAGSFMIEEMIQKGWNVTPMNFRTWKVKKYGAFRRMLDTGKVESYPDDALKKEMFAMEYSQGSTQSYIQHATGYSDDLIDGFVMSSFHFLQTEYGGNTYNMDDYDTGESYW